jgi:hypothetical protein
MERMNIYYDEEGDFLEITSGNISNCFFDNIGNGVFKIVDKGSGEIKGLAIHNFKTRTKSDTLEIDLPFDVNFSALKV